MLHMYVHIFIYLSDLSFYDSFVQRYLQLVFAFYLAELIGNFFCWKKSRNGNDEMFY